MAEVSDSIKPVTSGQKSQFVTRVHDVSHRCAQRALQAQIDGGHIDHVRMQKILRSDQLRPKLEKALREIVYELSR